MFLRGCFSLTHSLQNLVIMATIAFNTFVNPWAMDHLHWYYHLVYIGWLAIELIFVYIFVVETKREQLSPFV